ncbi:hypothetical protein MTR67_049835 [Solanum verrucosum]|uniref:RecA family profile 1 domain-containing protein n=1 Tax=Solanum verrucosum TaxID=315347 RepID=A0AAF1A0Z7_SOLVR|nr:hypothetical protein MTR67_049835 [Solanum verrucosum]
MLFSCGSVLLLSAVVVTVFVTICYFLYFRYFLLGLLWIGFLSQGSIGNSLSTSEIHLPIGFSLLLVGQIEYAFSNSVTYAALHIYREVVFDQDMHATNFMYVTEDVLCMLSFVHMNNMAAEIIMQVFVPNFSTPSALSQVDKSLQQVMKNIVCFSVFDIFTLFEVLHQLKNNLRSQKDEHIRMLIIDSISSLIAPILGGGAHGHALMLSAGFLLKRLAHEHDISILVTNHMVAGERGTSKPALGESWRSIPHVRLLLSKDRISNISSISVLRHPHMATGDRVEFELQ